MGVGVAVGLLVDVPLGVGVGVGQSNGGPNRQVRASTSRFEERFAACRSNFLFLAPLADLDCLVKLFISAVRE